jgi:hypothetical protein
MEEPEIISNFSRPFEYAHAAILLTHTFFNTGIKVYTYLKINLHTYIPRFISKRIVNASQIVSDGRLGVVVRILANYAKGREFDSRTVPTFVSMDILFVLGLGVSMYNMYV